MPDDIEPISEEDLFKQQFLKQLTPDGDPSVIPGNPVTPIPGSELTSMPKPLAAIVSGTPGSLNPSAVPPAPVSLNLGATLADVNTPNPIDKASAATAEDTVASESETKEVTDATKNAEEEAKAAELKKKLEEADLAEEAPDTDMVKIPFDEKPYVEWKGLFEIKEERDEIDDGRKDGKDGVEGEMTEEEEQNEFTVITDKEFQAQLLGLQMPTLMKFFRPELLNRFDEIIFFSPLRKKELIQIVDVMLRETREMLGEKNIQLKLSDAARDFIADMGYNPAFGARPLRRAIQEHLEDPLSDLLIMEKFKSGDSIYADLKGKKLEFTKDVGTGKVEDMFEQLDESVAKNEEAKAGEGKVVKDGEVGVKDPFAEIYGDDLNGNPAAAGQKQPGQADPAKPGIPGDTTNPTRAGQNPAVAGQAPGAAPAGSNPFPGLSGNQAVPDAMGNWPTAQAANANDPNSANTSPFTDVQTAENQIPAETMAGVSVGDSQETKKHGLFGKMFAK